MFLIDDVLFFPVRSLVWIFREIQHAAEKDKAGESAAITVRLGELYMMLETGQMTEAEFDAAEKTLLDRLDVLQEETSAAAAETGDEAEDEDDADGGQEDAAGDEAEDEDDADGGQEDAAGAESREGRSKGGAES